jgi:hypothetical protein
MGWRRGQASNALEQIPKVDFCAHGDELSDSVNELNPDYLNELP